MAEIKQVHLNGITYDIHAKKSDQTIVGYGLCETAGATADKVVSISNADWALSVGSIIGVKFTNNNSASNVSLNVNNTGAKFVAYSRETPYTGSSTTYTGAANRVIYYMYDGNYWHWINIDGSLDMNTIPSAHCTTAAATAAKVASFSYYSLTPNRYLQINLQYANSAKNALTLNINSTGAKPIYINGVASSSTNYTLPAGPYIIYCDGNNYYFRTDGTIPTSTGDAGKLTDTTYSAAANNAITLSGTTFSHSTANGYKHIPSGGAANQALVYDSAGTAKWQNIITFARWEDND